MPARPTRIALVKLSQAEVETLVLQAQACRSVTDPETGAVRHIPTPQSEVALVSLLKAYEPMFKKIVSDKAARLGAEDALQEVQAAFVEFVRTYVVGSNPTFRQVIRTVCARALHDQEATATIVTVRGRNQSLYWQILASVDGDDNAAYRRVIDENLMERDTFLRIHAAQHSDSLEALLTEGDDDATPHMRRSRSAFAVADPAPGPEDVYMTQALVHTAFASVDERKETICRLRYGFDDPQTLRLREQAGFRNDGSDAVMSDREVAVALQPRSNEKTVNRHRLQALKTMREALEDDGYDGTSGRRVGR